MWTLLLAACGNGNTAQTADNVERVQQTGRILHIDIDAGQITIETMTASTAGTEGQPPEKPEGSTEMQQPPEKPEGSAEMQQPPEAPENGKAPNAGNGTVYTVTSQTGILDADGNSAALSALQEFSVVTFTADGDTLLAVAITADMQNGMAGPGGHGKNERIGRHRFRPDGICRGEPLYRGCLGDVRDADVGRNRRVHRLGVEWRSGHIARYYG